MPTMEKITLRLDLTAFMGFVQLSMGRRRSRNTHKLEVPVESTIPQMQPAKTGRSGSLNITANATTPTREPRMFTICDETSFASIA